MFRSIVLLVGGLASLWANSLPAQDAILGQKYGQGVHAYFSGDYSQAFEQLTAAIEGGSKDPRAFYFRGLTYLQFGRPQEAKQDFQKGADLESRDVNKFYDVSKSLERVQGPARTELENYRVEARMAVMQQAEQAPQGPLRGDSTGRVAGDARAAPRPPEPIKTPEPAAEPAAETAADPFAAPEEKAAPKAAKKPAKPAKKPADDESAEKPAEGAADEKKAAEPAAGDDPFAAPPAKPAAKPAPARRLAKAADAAAEGQDEKPPAAEEKPADNANPFGEEPAADEKKPAAGEEARRQETGQGRSRNRRKRKPIPTIRLPSSGAI